MGDDETVVTMKLHHETDKAYLMSIDGDEDNAVWLPKSKTNIESKGKNVFEVMLPIWLAAKKGLI